MVNWWRLTIVVEVGITLEGYLVKRRILGGRGVEGKCWRGDVVVVGVGV